MYCYNARGQDKTIVLSIFGAPSLSIQFFSVKNLHRTFLLQALQEWTVEKAMAGTVNKRKKRED